MTRQFCEQCGFKLSSDAKFCGGCGMALDQSAPKPKAATRRKATARRRPVKWRSVEDEVDLTGSPYATESLSSVLMGSLMMAAGFGGRDDGPQPPLVTTWSISRDDGVLRRTSMIGDLATIFGEFAKSVGLLDGPWDALEIKSPLGNQGLVMVSEASWPDPDRESGLRLVVPVAYGIDPRGRDRAQVQASVDWILSKMASPYLGYVPVIADESQRDDAMKQTIARSGTHVPGPLSDVTWLRDSSISAVGCNPRGFPGSGSLRIGILDECDQPRQRAVFRDGSLTLVDVPGGTVDVYAGWQIDSGSFGLLGLMALGHRSLLGIIDALAESDQLAAEFGGIPVTG